MAKDSISKSFTTCVGEVTGFISVAKPSVLFDKDGLYFLNILIPKEVGIEYVKTIEQLTDEQFEKYRKNNKKIEITACVPYVEVVKDDKGRIIKETPDPEGRYILKTKNKAYIKDGEIGLKIPVFDSKLKPVTNVNFGVGSKVKLGVSFDGYSSNLGTGVSVKLRAVQLLEVCSFGNRKAQDFFTEEEGFEFVEEDVENQAENDEEADF